MELEELLKELSWSLRLKLLNEIKPVVTTTAEPLPENTLAVNERRNALTARAPTRRVGVAALVQHQDVPKRRQLEVLDPPVPTAEEITADENNMRLKLFRLMYETVRDSDLKVRRAELIQNNYSNSTQFQIGYLMGDVTDKYTAMSDISSTIARFYAEWKPIEHINAYEQIANQAIEISHLIELVRLANKRDGNPTDPKRI